MAQIGIFTRVGTGFAGRLRTLGLDAELRFEPVASEADNAPDFRIHLGDSTSGPEIGAGWRRTGEKAGDYVSVMIDDPAFTQPLRANLFLADRQGKVFHLIWNRLVRRHDVR